MKPPTFTGQSNAVVYFLDTVGLIRTLAAGTWIYITSTDDHFMHDVGMIVYLVLTLIYMIGMVIESRRISRTWDPSPERIKCAEVRTYFLFAFVAAIPVLVWLFIRHKVKHLPGAYSYYAYSEWSLILVDVGFDAISYLDFRKVDLVMVTMAPMGQANYAAKKGGYVSSESVVSPVPAKAVAESGTGSINV
jgi:hypothetical protein